MLAPSLAPTHTYTHTLAFALFLYSIFHMNQRDTNDQAILKMEEWLDGWSIRCRETKEWMHERKWRGGMNEWWNLVEGKEQRRLQQKDGEDAGPSTGQSVLISVCNKESETLSPREDMVHLMSALTRTLCVCARVCVRVNACVRVRVNVCVCVCVCDKDCVCLKSKDPKYADVFIVDT